MSASAYGVFELAGRMRRGEVRLEPFALWEAAGSDGVVYRHAMIHAGAIGPRQDPDDGSGKWVPYTTCPTCEEELGDG